MNAKQQQEFAQMLAIALRGEQFRDVERTKAATGTMGYGPSGVFNMYGVNPNVMNAMKLNLQGLLTKIPFRANRFGSEKYALLTGVSAVTGANSADECGDAPAAGTVSIGKYTNSFGRWKLKTKTFDISRFAELKDRSAFADYTLTGDPFAESPVSLDAPSDTSKMMREEVAKLMFELKVGWLRTFNKVLLYTGNPANNVGAGYLEPKGLDLLINTGYQDVDTAVALPEIDSLIRSFGSVNIDTVGSVSVGGITYPSGGSAAVAEIVAMWRYLNITADRTGLSPVKWAIAMTRGLFYEITAAWPCNYLTARCTPQNGSLTLDAGDQIALRDEMRNGSHLMIDGEQVQVVIDNDIVDTPTTGVYTTSIYFVPLTVNGGTPVTFGEFFDFAQPGGAIEASNLLGNMGDMTTTGNGRFLWTRERVATCLNWVCLERSRLVLTTPHLAGRLTNINYTPLMAYDA